MVIGLAVGRVGVESEEGGIFATVLSEEASGGGVALVVEK